MSIETQVAIVGLLLSALTFLLGQYFGHRSSRASIGEPILVSMLNEFRSPEFKAKQFWVTTELKSFSPCSPYALPKDHRFDVLSVCHFFDLLGALAANKVVPEKLVLSFMGGAMQRVWEAVEPYVQQHRKQYYNDYQFYFSEFYLRSKRYDLEAMRRKSVLRWDRLKRVAANPK